MGKPRRRIAVAVLALVCSPACHTEGKAAHWIQACGCRRVSEYRWVIWSCQWAHYSMHRGAGTLTASLAQTTLHFELLVAAGTDLWRKFYCFFLFSGSKWRTQSSARTGCINTHTLALVSATFTSTIESPVGAQVKNSTPRRVSGSLHAAQFALKRRFVLSTQIGRHRFWETLGTRHLKWAAQIEGTVLQRGKGKNV